MMPGMTSMPRRGGGGVHDMQVVPFHEEQQRQHLVGRNFVDTISGDCVYFKALINEMVKMFPRDHVLGANKFKAKTWRKWKTTLGGPNGMGSW